METHHPEGGSTDLRLPLDISRYCKDRALTLGDGLPPSAPVELPSKPLIRDLDPSRHSVPFVPEPKEFETAQGSTCSISSMSSDRRPEVDLEKTVELMNNAQCHGRRALAARRNKEQLAISRGVEKRLLKTMWIAYGNLIDQFKTDDQAGFRGLYEASDHLSMTCHRAHLGRIPGNNPGEARNSTRHPTRTCTPWMQRLSTADQEVITSFLHLIRTDEEFLANRIVSLSPEQLNALASSYHPAGIDLSILANHSHGATDLYSKDSQMLKLSRRMDNLRCFHAQDPFFLLMYSCFDSNCNVSSPEYHRRNSVWSSTCAKLIVESKPGSDEFIVAAADSFMGFADWKLKRRLELFILETLVEGSFLLEPLQAASSDSGDKPRDMASPALQEADFMEQCLRTLFQLLASEPDGQFLPRACMDLIQSTLQKVGDDDLKSKAKVFFITRWYFASLLSSILLYPEVRIAIYVLLN